jgi:alkanesulfonate monooxygenase SsuD/methylene tetrahydromethanopterin reductase-like flavin-dependent oxidoreductase (luciferase family)
MEPTGGQLKVKFGAGISNCREGKVYPSGFTTTQSLVAVALASESSGFDYLWGNDLQTTFDEALQSAPQLNFYEIHAAFAYIAARTERIRMLSALVTLPLRDPVLLAKQTATLDCLSGGRYVLGAGLGGKRTELERLRGRFSKSINRGEWLDESLELILRLFNEDTVNHDGKYFSVAGARVYPKPEQVPFPIYFTGAGEDMLRRTAQYGAGWIHMNVTPEAIVTPLRQLEELCAESNTSYEALDKCLLFDAAIAESEDDAAARWDSSLSSALSKARGRGSSASALVGTPASITQQLLPYTAAGITHFGCIFAGSTVDEVLAQIRLFGAQVIPAVTARSELEPTVVG